jgi:HD-GYP domain-containing protein (c-di-GMP phosphodiesterase class II)
VAPRNRTSVRSAQAGRQAADAPKPAELPAPSRAQLAVAFSQALDLAEGRPVGHAARVCYVTLSLVRSLSLPAEEQRSAFYASLLHDAGAAPASAETCRLLNLSEQALFGGPPGQSPQQLALELAPANVAPVASMLRSHPKRGADVARELGFDKEVQKAIDSHHERWDGQGYPHALKEEAIPIAGRIVAAADIVETLIESETNPLTARRNLVAVLAEHGGNSMDPELARAARDLVRSDTFWLGLHDDALTRELAAVAPDRQQATRSPEDLQTFAGVFANLGDAKGEHTAQHGDRTAAIADSLAQALALGERDRALLRLAAQVHDIGLLGVPARVIAKPDILSLSEMEAMRKHPSLSEQVLETIPELRDVATWIGAHHERPDGRGYPEMLGEDRIPLESRILAVADTYVALTSPRPYRRALSHEDALQVLQGGAGTQLDAKLVRVLCSMPEIVTSFRSAPRSRRTR